MASVEGPDHSSNLHAAGIDGKEMGVFGRELVWDEAFPPGTGGGTDVAHASEEVRTLYFLPLLSDDSRTSQAVRFFWLLSLSWLTVLSHRLGTANKIAPGYSLLSHLGSFRTS